MTIKRVCLYSRTYFIEWLQMFLPTFYLEEAIKQDSKHGLYTTVNHFSILRLETAQYWDLRLTASVSGDCSESHSRDGGNNYIQIGRSLAPTQFWAFYPLELQVSVVCPRLPPHLHHLPQPSASTLKTPRSRNLRQKLQFLPSVYSENQTSPSWQSSHSTLHQAVPCISEFKHWICV